MSSICLAKQMGLEERVLAKKRGDITGGEMEELGGA